MEKFKTILKKALSQQTLEVHLLEGSEAKIILKNAQAVSLKEEGFLQAAWIDSIIAALFPNDKETLMQFKPVKGEMSILNAGKIHLIATHKSPHSLFLFMPPDGELLSKAYWEKMKKEEEAAIALAHAKSHAKPDPIPPPPPSDVLFADLFAAKTEEQLSIPIPTPIPVEAPATAAVAVEEPPTDMRLEVKEPETTKNTAPIIPDPDTPAPVVPEPVVVKAEEPVKIPDPPPKPAPPSPPEPEPIASVRVTIPPQLLSQREKCCFILSEDQELYQKVSTAFKEMDFFSFSFPTWDEVSYILDRYAPRMLVLDESAKDYDKIFKKVYDLQTEKRLSMYCILISKKFPSLDSRNAFVMSFDMIVNVHDLGKLLELIEKNRASKMDIYRIIDRLQTK